MNQNEPKASAIELEFYLNFSLIFQTSKQGKSNFQLFSDFARSVGGWCSVPSTKSSRRWKRRRSGADRLARLWVHRVRKNSRRIRRTRKSCSFAGTEPSRSGNFIQIWIQCTAQRSNLIESITLGHSTERVSAKFIRASHDDCLHFSCFFFFVLSQI